MTTHYESERFSLKSGVMGATWLVGLRAMALCCV
jgi:hypothetical protein